MYKIYWDFRCLFTCHFRYNEPMSSEPTSKVCLKYANFKFRSGGVFLNKMKIKMLVDIKIWHKFYWNFYTLNSISESTFIVYKIQNNFLFENISLWKIYKWRNISTIVSFKIFYSQVSLKTLYSYPMREMSQ